MSLHNFNHNEARRNKIDAIKALREVTDLSIKEAKDIVESIYEGCSYGMNPQHRVVDLERQNYDLIQKLNEVTAALEKEIKLSNTLSATITKTELLDLIRNS